MKKVYLLGDSIMHIGYGTVLSDVLGEEYEVLRPVSFVKIQGGDICDHNARSRYAS